MATYVFHGASHERYEYSSLSWGSPRKIPKQSGVLILAMRDGQSAVPILITDCLSLQMAFFQHSEVAAKNFGANLAFIRTEEDAEVAEAEAMDLIEQYYPEMNLQAASRP